MHTYTDSHTQSQTHKDTTHTQTHLNTHRHTLTLTQSFNMHETPLLALFRSPWQSVSTAFQVVKNRHFIESQKIMNAIIICDLHLWL